MNSMPSITGMLMSVMTTSTFSLASTSRPFWPSSACSTSNPALVRVWCSIARMVRESSTVRTRIRLLSFHQCRQRRASSPSRSIAASIGALASVTGNAKLLPPRRFGGAEQHEQRIGRRRARPRAPSTVTGPASTLDQPVAHVVERVEIDDRRQGHGLVSAISAMEYALPRKSSRGAVLHGNGLRSANPESRSTGPLSAAWIGRHDRRLSAGQPACQLGFWSLSTSTARTPSAKSGWRADQRASRRSIASIARQSSAAGAPPMGGENGREARRRAASAQRAAATSDIAVFGRDRCDDFGDRGDARSGSKRSDNGRPARRIGASPGSIALGLHQRSPCAVSRLHCAWPPSTIRARTSLRAASGRTMHRRAPAPAHRPPRLRAAQQEQQRPVRGRLGEDGVDPDIGDKPDRRFRHGEPRARLW